MSPGRFAAETLQQVRPLLSIDHIESRRKVLSLYKTWYREMPNIIHKYDIPKSKEQCREKIREEFLRHRNVTDLRVIDMLLIKGQMELRETVNRWKDKSHLMRYWKDGVEVKPKDFLSRFYEGHE
uniref:NADH dehydrogenase [ubiquinone] 1 alpha subcomplex subunit 6 n=1 Tax=Culex tarsalis TaxID=7177 RepID=A0A1Q3FT21_CULTA